MKRDDFTNKLRYMDSKRVIATSSKKLRYRHTNEDR